jgi:hypothetical protein
LQSSLKKPQKSDDLFKDGKSEVNEIIFRGAKQKGTFFAKMSAW